MARLNISKFSCIEQAELDLGRLTILIGPQASGKSLMCKLVYFFYDVIGEKLFDFDKGRDLKSLLDRIAVDFRKEFPPSCWGREPFEIEFAAGLAKISIRGGPPMNGGAVDADASDYVKEFVEHVNSSMARLDIAEQDLSYPEAVLRLERRLREKLQTDLGDDNVRVQTFIPAGRSFFTSIGKTIAALEQSDELGAATAGFGRLYTMLRSRWDPLYSSYWRIEQDENSKAAAEWSRLTRELFDGEIEITRDTAIISAADGRKLPFHLLSSGHQELMPLWLVLRNAIVTAIDFPEMSRLIFIEEPEAHLFPATQNRLVEFLVSLLTYHQSFRLVMTTHSPYLLAKINNLLKAGALAESGPEDAAGAVGRIVSRSSWLGRNQVRAYGVIDGRLKSILAEDGLIDALYLDDVSGEVAREFSELLEIEFGA